jgi:hypothetical protein
LTSFLLIIHEFPRISCKITSFFSKHDGSQNLPGS